MLSTKSKDEKRNYMIILIDAEKGIVKPQYSIMGKTLAKPETELNFLYLIKNSYIQPLPQKSLERN